MKIILTTIVMLFTAVSITAQAEEIANSEEEASEWIKTLPAANADYGSYPTNYKKIIKAELSNSLKDPDSAKYSSFSTPIKEHAIENQFQKEAIYGYAVCANVNAKNSYGGYTGNQQFWFLIRNNKVVRTQETDKQSFIYIGHDIKCQYK